VTYRYRGIDAGAGGFGRSGEGLAGDAEGLVGADELEMMASMSWRARGRPNDLASEKAWPQERTYSGIWVVMKTLNGASQPLEDDGGEDPCNDRHGHSSRCARND
jgi:hypothetical protein